MLALYTIATSTVTTWLQRNAGIIAACALVVSAVTATVQVLNFLRDRRDVKIYTRREMETFDIDGVEVGGQMQTLVIVANDGRRPFTITRVIARGLFPKGGFISLNCFPQLPVELTEGQRLAALADEDVIDLAEVEAWEVEDAAGHPYRQNVAPWAARLRSRLRMWWIKPAPKSI
jgi:hypothetical protein